ncbi:MAG: hypothetical protein WKF96_02905 [Solirubrobacteraceae bacterium]
MAHDRAGTGPWGWIKAVGSAERPLQRDWRDEDSHLLTSCWFSKHPRSLRAGDVLVYYAARWGTFCALMELISDDVSDDGGAHPVDGQRWRWRMDVRPLVTLSLDDAPTLAQAGIDPLRVRRQSHIVLTSEEYETISGLILARASRSVQEPDSDAQPKAA